MLQDKQQLTKTSHVLLYLLAVQSLFADFTQHRSFRNAVIPEYGKYFRERQLERTVRRLERQGWITYELKETKRIYKLTAKGELEGLLTKLQLTKPPREWDGKWRLLMFDIPEGARNIRKRLRLTLRDMRFHCIQASVYVSPWPVSNEAIHVLKASGLIRYIRLARADFDDDSDLRRIYKLRT